MCEDGESFGIRHDGSRKAGGGRSGSVIQPGDSGTSGNCRKASDTGGTDLHRLVRALMRLYLLGAQLRWTLDGFEQSRGHNVHSLQYLRSAAAVIYCFSLPK